MTTQTTGVLNVSWSQVRQAEECRQRAYLVRQKKRSPARNLRNYFPGIVADSLMRRWLQDPAQGPMVDLVDDVLNHQLDDVLERKDGVVRWRDPEDRQHVRDQVYTLAQNLEPKLQELILPYDYEDGVWFRAPAVISGLDNSPTQIKLVGEIDILVRQPEGWAVWDLKATVDDSYWRKTIAQLTFYSLGVKAAYGDFPVRQGLIQPLCKQQVIEVGVGAEEHRQLIVRIMNYCHDVWRGDFTPTDDLHHCTMCDTRHACSRYIPPADGGRGLVA